MLADLAQVHGHPETGLAARKKGKFRMRACNSFCLGA